MVRFFGSLKVAGLLLVASTLAACSTTEPPTAPVTPTQPSASAIKPGTAEDFRVNVGDTVFFDLDQHALRADAQAILQKQAAWLQKFPAVKLVVEGHCDERGTREYNLALSEKRANSAKDFLVANGIAANRVKTLPLGKERPVALGHDEASWAQNRRAVTVITSGAGS
jgi:peptidoglycan-associated lipoprotein